MPTAASILVSRASAASSGSRLFVLCGSATGMQISETEGCDGHHENAGSGLEAEAAVRDFIPVDDLGDIFFGVRYQPNLPGMSFAS
jgi:hypothetical protein